MKALTPSEIISAFDPVDRKDVVAPIVDGIDWDSKDYLAWSDSSGLRTFVVISLRARNVGLVFRTDGTYSQGMCDICFSVDREAGATMAMVDSWSNPRKSIGVHICRNFDCSDAARGQRALEHMRETISVGRRVERLQMNLERFVRSVIAQ